MSAIKELIVFDIILHFIEIIIRMANRTVFITVEDKNETHDEPEESIHETEVEEDYPEEENPEEVEEEISQE